METKLYYIHGLHGSNQSKKFLELKEHYPDIQCLSWEITDDINLKLQEWKQIINDNSADVDCVIASSTGANFACQLRKLCKPNYIKLVLINPLFDVYDVYDGKPREMSKYLEKIENLSDSIILIGEKDTVINNQKYLFPGTFINNNNQIILDKESSHRFENLNNYLNVINQYIDIFYT
jgi:predicted esterase YcpF (UPF0227 family)